jgi:hypothetical protein
MVSASEGDHPRVTRATVMKLFTATAAALLALAGPAVAGPWMAPEDVPTYASGNVLTTPSSYGYVSPAGRAILDAVGHRQILPNLFASRFCELRSVGVTQADAFADAYRYSMIQGQAPVVRMADGSTMGSDVVLSFNAIQKRCAWAYR